MNNKNLEIRLAIIGITTIALLVWGVSFLKGKNIFNNGTHYYSVYQDVGGIESSAPVRINGYTVGKVSEVYFHPNNSGNIILKFEMHEEFAIPKNTVATIYNSDLMGSKAILLNLGNSAIYAKSGDTLYSEIEGNLKDEVNKQVLPLKNKAEDLISSIDSVMTVITTVLDKDARQSLTNSLISLNRTFSTMELAMVRLDSMIYYNDNRVTRILTNVESITTNLHNNNKAIGNVIKNFEAISDTIAKSKIRSTINNLDSSLKQFDEVISKINKGKGSVGLLINDNQLYTNLATASNQLEQLLSDMKNRPKRYLNFSLLGGQKTNFEFKKNPVDSVN